MKDMRLHVLRHKRSINGYCSLYDLEITHLGKKYEYIDTSSLNDYKNVIVIVNSEPIGIVNRRVYVYSL